MIPFTLLPARIVVRRGSRPSTGHDGARSNPALVPRLQANRRHLMRSRYCETDCSWRPNVVDRRTLPVRPLADALPPTLKSP
jgi:hypothetical protein